MTARLGNVLFWLCIIIAGAWLWLAHSMGADLDSPAMVYGGAGIGSWMGAKILHPAALRLKRRNRGAGQRGFNAFSPSRVIPLNPRPLACGLH